MRTFLVIAVSVLSTFNGILGLPCFNQFLQPHSVDWRPVWSPRFPVQDIWPQKRGYRPGLIFESPTQQPKIPQNTFLRLPGYKGKSRDKVIVVLPPSTTTTARPIEEKPKIIVVLPPVAKISPRPFSSVKGQGWHKPNLSPKKRLKTVQSPKSVTTKQAIQYTTRNPTTIRKIYSYQTQKPPPTPKRFEPFSLSPKTVTSSPLVPAPETVTLTDDPTIKPEPASVETEQITTLSTLYAIFAEVTEATPEPVEMEQSGNGEEFEITLSPYRLNPDISAVIVGGPPEPVLENVHPVYSNPSLRGIGF